MKHFIITLSLLVISFHVKAQFDDSPDDYSLLTKKEKIVVGGEIGASVGTDFTFITLAPTIGYRTTSKITNGISIRYQYLNNKFYNFTNNIYGGGIWTNYAVLEKVTLHTELELLSTKTFNTFDATFSRVTVPIWFVGLGYRSSIGQNSSFQILTLYDIINDKNTPYQPLFSGIPIYLKLGFSIGL